MAQSTFQWQSMPGEFVSSGVDDYSANPQRTGLTRRVTAPSPSSLSPVAAPLPVPAVASGIVLIETEESQSSLSLGKIIGKLVLLFLCCGVGLYGGVWYAKTYKVSELESRFHNMIHEAQEVERQLRDELSVLEIENFAAELQYHKINSTLQKVESRSEEIRNLMGKLTAERQSLHQSIQQESKRILKEKKAKELN